MSAPLVVNTTDGMVWTLREGTRDGFPLYAPKKCGQCPEFVMATYAELEEHGIVGSAVVLPMPVVPEPRPRTMLDRARDALNARMTKDNLRLVLENVVTYAAALEAELRATNEDACTCPSADRVEPHQVGCLLAERPVNALTAVFAPVASLREPEPEFHAYLHHDSRVPHDLPETGGNQ